MVVVVVVVVVGGGRSVMHAQGVLLGNIANSS